MTDYAKVRLAATYSENSDYSSPLTSTTFGDWDLTPDEYAKLRLEVDTTGTILDLAPYGTVTAVLIKNTDSTNFAEVKWRYAKSTKTFASNAIGFTAGPPATVTDDDSTFVSTLRAKAGDYAVISGATEATNSGTFFIQAVAAGTLTLAEAATITLDADDVGTPTIAIHVENEDRIPPDGFLVICNPVPGSDLVFDADTAAVELDIFICGT